MLAADPPEPGYSDLYAVEEGYAYYAPPPPGVTTLTLDSGPYSTLPDVPVKS